MKVRCRKCKIDMLPVVYGLPGANLVDLAERGEILLGGCCIEKGLPTMQCPQCGHTKGKLGSKRG